VPRARSTAKSAHSDDARLRKGHSTAWRATPGARACVHRRELAQPDDKGRVQSGAVMALSLMAMSDWA